MRIVSKQKCWCWAEQLLRVFILSVRFPTLSEQKILSWNSIFVFSCSQFGRDSSYNLCSNIVKNYNHIISIYLLSWCFVLFFSFNLHLGVLWTWATYMQYWQLDDAYQIGYYRQSKHILFSCWITAHWLLTERRLTDQLFCFKIKNWL